MDVHATALENLQIMRECLDEREPLDLHGHEFPIGAEEAHAAWYCRRIRGWLWNDPAMPFVELRWDPARVHHEELLTVRDAVRLAVADALTRHDPAHHVTADMVDVAVRPYGPDDRVGPAAYVTVLARQEPARVRAIDVIVADITSAITHESGQIDTLVELVLGMRASAYRYEEQTAV